MNTEQLRTYAARDVARVRRHARVVIELRGTGKPHISENPSAVLEVVAIIGPGENGQVSIPEAVLCEVGLRRTRPYRPSGHREHRSVNPTRPYRMLVPRRRQDFSLKPHQYRVVAPFLFSMLFSWMRLNVDSWKDKVYTFRTQRLYVNLKKRLTDGQRSVSYPRGCRISVSRSDVFLCADLLRAEYHDPFWDQQLTALVMFLIYALKPLEGGYKYPFRDNEPVKRISELLRHRVVTSIPPHILATLPRYLWGERGEWNSKYGPPKNWKFVYEVEELVRDVIGPAGGERSWQFQTMGYTLPGFADRLPPQIVVRDISSLRNSEKTKPYHVFELLPVSRTQKL